MRWAYASLEAGASAPQAVRVRVRPLLVSEADACVACAKTIGWSAPREAWAWMLELGLGFGIDAKGDLAGSVIVFPFGEAFAMVAMMMVRADMQKQGLGRRVLEHARSALPASMGMALYASEEGERLYRPLGFADDGFSVRWEGRIAAPSRLPLGHGLREMVEDDLDAVVALDAVAQGAVRRALVRSLMVRRAAGWVLERGRRIVGFVMGLREEDVLRVGPLVAETDADALALADAVAPSSGVVRLDVEPGEDALVAWAKARGLEQGELSPRLVLGMPRLPGARRHSRTLAGRAFG